MTTAAREHHKTLPEAILEIESKFDIVQRVDAGDSVPVATGQVLSPEDETNQRIPFQEVRQDGGSDHDAIDKFVASFPKGGGTRLVWREMPTFESPEQIAAAEARGEGVVTDKNGKTKDPKAHKEKNGHVLRAKFAVIGPRDNPKEAADAAHKDAAAENDKAAKKAAG